MLEVGGLNFERVAPPWLEVCRGRSTSHTDTGGEVPREGATQGVTIIGIPPPQKERRCAGGKSALLGEADLVGGQVREKYPTQCSGGQDPSMKGGSDFGPNLTPWCCLGGPGWTKYPTQC